MNLGRETAGLLRKILNYAEQMKRPIRYQIIELSAGLKKQQQDRMGQASADTYAQVSWLERLPDPGFRGVMLAHEVLDAMPVRLFVHRCEPQADRKSTRLNSSHVSESRMPSSA